MKLKSKILSTFVIGLMAVGIVSIPTSSHATTDPNGGLYLGLEAFRNSGYSYMAIEKIMWKISSYDSTGTVANKDKTLYCLKGGPGFGSQDMGSVTPTKDRYTEYFDMKDLNAIPSPYKEVLPEPYNEETKTGGKYNSLVWVLEHCYVPAPSTNPTAEQTEIANSYKKELLTNAGIPENGMSDDEIDIAQQFAIWYFTNNDSYKTDGNVQLYISQFPNLVTTESQTLGDYYNDWDRDEYVKQLITYFIQKGEENATKAPVKTTEQKPISLTSSNTSIVSSGTNYILGPYTINQVGNNSDYSLEGILTTADGNSNVNYTLLDSNQSATTKTLKELVGTNFYISVPKTQPNVQGLIFKVKATIYSADVKFWSVAGASAIYQPVAEVVRNKKTYEEVASTLQFDLALRKFITKINDQELVNSDGTYTREPNIDLSPLVNKTGTTANYNHRKDPVGVSVGDIVIYTLRIYNEGKVDGYASSVTDYLPPQLEFVVDDEENFNAQYGWVIDSSLRKATTRNLSKEYDEDNLLKAFNGTKLDYKELKIKCRVKEVENLNKVITNIAEITEFTDIQGNSIIDIDSQANNINLPSDANLPDYKGNENNKSTLTDAGYFYKGQQDDDDFEKLILEEFDLALRKFITGVNDEPVTSRIPVFTNVKDQNGNYIYEHTKEPVEVETADIVEYTLRIYNEGDKAGYAKQVKDDIPEGLEFLPNHELNQQYRWIMVDKDGNETNDITKAVSITTDYLSKEQEQTTKENLIKAFDQTTMKSPDYRDIKVAFKVIAPSTHLGIITNIAEIADDSDEEGNPVIDRDSTPNNNNEKEDDIDVEHIKLNYFDLALRKFITAVNDTEVTNRYPVFKIDENGKYKYEHTKEPVEVVNEDIVTYTIRVYNEGTKAGYAEEVKDDIPEGLEFLPDHELNQKYRWVMIDENGNETNDVTKAVAIKTDSLSRSQAAEGNLLKVFDKDTMEEPDHREVKVAFKVTEPNTSDRIIINQAQIAEDADKDGKPVIDIDSTPDKWVDGEDDQDIEKIKVKYFDLALRKWVTQAIIIEDGKEKIVETGHKAEDDPEEVVKVELVESKLNKVVVKFRYKIRITNEGEIAGYATEISDYIPKGLKFVAADNPKWKEVEGKIVTDQLKDTLLQPGESAEVEVLLTWINAKDNFDLKVNVAEISKDKNDSNTPDIDSTPDNQKPGEDDIDDAPVILSIKTGTTIPIEYIGLVAGSILLIAGSTILIKKYVLL